MSADATPLQMRPHPLHVLLDTNVVLDLLFQRQPWFDEAAEFWLAWASGRITAHMLASILTDIYYIGRRQTDAVQAIAGVDRCLREFEILPLDRNISLPHVLCRDPISRIMYRSPAHRRLLSNIS